MKKYIIRFIKKTDIRDVLDIYNYHIENSLSNFEENKVTLIKFKKMISYILSKNLPFIIFEKDKKIIGFAFLNDYRTKSGYRFSFENSIYVHNNYMNAGVGNILLKNLIKYGII